MQKFSLIIPTLNEEKSIQKLLGELEEINKKIKNFKMDIIVVDDGSEDDTIKIVNKFKQKTNLIIKIIQRKEKGLANAIVRGFKESTSEVIGVMDADLSHPPQLLIKMMQKIENYNLVIGSRYENGGKVEEWPIFRKIGSLACNKLTLTLGVKIKDAMSGYFIVNRKVIKNIEFKAIGYKILLEILVKGSFNNFIEIPYTFKNREIGQSKMNSKIILEFFNHFFRLLNWKIRHKNQKNFEFI